MYKLTRFVVDLPWNEVTIPTRAAPATAAAAVAEAEWFSARRKGGGYVMTSNNTVKDFPRAVV